MTIAIGFVYDDGVMLGADSEFTVGTSKIDGLKAGDLTASWGQLASVFAGNVDFAAAVFQRFERLKESKQFKRDPLEALETEFAEFYSRHVLGHPDREEQSFALLLAIRLNGDKQTKFYRTTETVVREVKSFDCIGNGEDHARDLLRRLTKTRMNRRYSVALASYVLSHIKQHVQHCGGKSIIRSLDHNGPVDVASTDLESLAEHIERFGCWFVAEAQQFMLTHAQGNPQNFEKLVQVLCTRALHMRSFWDELMKSSGSRRQSPTDDPSRLPPWPE